MTAPFTDPVQIVLDAQETLPPSGDPIYCVSCDTRATVLWPVTHLHNESPYCDRCLASAKHALLVALGRASSL